MIGAVLSVTMILAAGTTVFASGAAEGKTFAIVTKAAGNPYNEKEADGFKEAIEDEGGKVIIKHRKQTDCGCTDFSCTVINFSGSRCNLYCR